MSFGIESKKLKKIIDLYYPNNHCEEIRYLVHLKGEQELLISITCTFQGISNNSIEQRVSAFGCNQIQSSVKPYTSIIKESFSNPRAYVLAIVSILFTLYSYYLHLIQNNYPLLLQSIFITVMVYFNIISIKYEEFYFTFRQTNFKKKINNFKHTVIRQNNREELQREDILVGDLVQFKEGEQIPADGLLIQSNDVVTIQNYTSTAVECKKDTLKMCIASLKSLSQELNSAQNCPQKKLNLNSIKSIKSPILVSGSKVKSGQGRMIVLCVGKLSRKGQFQKLSSNRLHQNILMAKIQSFLDFIFLWSSRLTLLYFFIYIGVSILNMGEKKSLLQLKWNYLMNGISALLIVLPSGLYIGIFLGCFVIKIKLYLSGIFSSLSLDVLKMCFVSEICLSKQQKQTNLSCFEFWNQGSFKLRAHPNIKGNYDIQQNFDGPINEDFKVLINQYMDLLGQEQKPNVSKNEYTSKVINEMTVYYRQNEQKKYFQIGDINYMVVSTELRKPLLNQSQILNSEMMQNSIENSQQSKLFYQNDNIKLSDILNDINQHNYITYIRSDSQQTLNLCSHIMSMSRGILEPLTSQKRTFLLDLIKAMNKKLVKVYLVTFVLTNDKSSSAEIKNLQRKNLKLLFMYGVCQMNDHKQFEIIRKFKQIGVNMVLTSSRGLQQTILESKYISFNAVEKDTLAFDGQQFMGLIQGIICNSCKRSLCICENESKEQAKIKNNEQFLKIIKYLKILYNATYYHKYTLLMGYQNNDKQTAFIGSEEEDLPALARSYLSISAKQSCCNQKSSVTIPGSSISNIYFLIKQSRFAYQFIRKYIQLTLPASFVPAFILLFSGIFFGQQIFCIKQILWVHLFICPALALSLSLQSTQQDIIEQNQFNYSKSSSLITEPMKNQIISQTIFQICILLFLMMTGHLFIPEGIDKIDNVIGINWFAKYHNDNFNTVASGLYYNPLVNTPSYQTSFQTYHIFSRHLTIIYNIYVLFQIFNYLNCRKIKVAQINIVQGISIKVIFILISIITSQFFFISMAAQKFDLYPEGLRADQWLFSLGMSMIVWIIGFMSKLLGEQGVQREEKKQWRNKSFKLGVKLLLANDKLLGQFQVEDDVQFKYT